MAVIGGEGFTPARSFLLINTRGGTSSRRVSRRSPDAGSPLSTMSTSSSGRERKGANTLSSLLQWTAYPEQQIAEIVQVHTLVS